MSGIRYAMPLISPCFYAVELYICEIRGFHGGEDDDAVLLGFGTVWTRR
jgi:hypothetical protein